MNGALPAPAGFREAVVDLGAIAANTGALLALARERGMRELIAVVKAEAYGHGMEPVARTVLASGASGLGVADVGEALALRAAGIEAPVICWLHGEDTDFAPAVAAGIDLAVSSARQLFRVLAAGAATGATPRVQLKLDTGLSRNGIPAEDWDAVFGAVAAAVQDGRARLTGVFSHLANASEESDESAARALNEGIARLRALGAEPGSTHLAATGALMRRPGWGMSAARVGIGLYGLTPFAPQEGPVAGLRPAMTLRATVAAVRRVPKGTGVSYDHSYRTSRETTLALVPLGYADGVPRAASDVAPVRIGERLHRIAGRVAMDQFVVDVGDAPVRVGEEVVLFGDPAAGAPSADEWAAACGTIGYEIVTRIGPRVPRRYLQP